MSLTFHARRWALFGATALAVAACGSTNSSATPQPTVSSTPSNQTVVQIVDAYGNRVATATLTPAAASSPSSFSASPGTSPTPTPLPGTGTPVHFHVVVNGGLTPGSHGFQIHAKGVCEAPAFTTSGPDFNPTEAAHGFDHVRGPHAGDLPDLAVGTDGQATMDFVTSLVTLDSGQPNSLQSTDGTSLVIERDVDDQRTQPDGGAGPRIACGVIFPPQSTSPTPSPSGSATAGTTPTPMPVPSARATTPSTPAPSSSALPTASGAVSP